MYNDILEQVIDEEKALNIALNKVSGEWDMPKLADILEELDKSMFDISITGFDAAEIDELFSKVHDKEISDDDFDTDKTLEEIEEPIVYTFGWISGITVIGLAIIFILRMFLASKKVKDSFGCLIIQGFMCIFFSKIHMEYTYDIRLFTCYRGKFSIHKFWWNSIDNANGSSWAYTKHL